MLDKFIIILPELTLVLLSLFGQLGATIFPLCAKYIARVSIILSILIIGLILLISRTAMSGFTDSFVINEVSGVFKIITLSFTILTMILYLDFCKISNSEFKMEFITIILLSNVGIFLAISSRNFLLLFCALELQALSAYALAGFKITSVKSSESAMKYFILGSFLSCLTLLGISFIYGFSGGNLQFHAIRGILNHTQSINLGLVIGIILILAGICFKLSAAPLHIWTPDVYEGAPIISVTYFASAQKFGALCVLFNIIEYVAYDYRTISIDLIRIIAILSMIVGCLGGIMQNSLKRLMAYSAILNIGYALIGIVTHNASGKFAAMFYIITYIIGLMGFFTCLLALFGEKSDDVSFIDIKGIGFHRKMISIAITIIMFSNIGLPPFAGFFGKYNIFYQAILIGEFTLAFCGIITTIVAAYYYLKIIRFIYFKPNVMNYAININRNLSYLIVLIISFLLFFPCLLVYFL
jgi:NADH-quinone oxidoreductase subunit N